MISQGSAASNTTWINPLYVTTTTLGSSYIPPPAPGPLDEIEWLRGRIDEITALCA